MLSRLRPRWLFPTHLRRLSFFVRYLLFYGYFLWVMVEFDGEIPADPSQSIHLAMAILLSLYAILFIYRPRLIDCGMSPWTLIFAFIPIVSGFFGLILLFGRSSAGSELTEGGKRNRFM